MSTKKAAVKKGSSGMAFDVILKPAASDVPPTPRGMKPGSQGHQAPNISKKDIEKKLKEAEQQRKARDLERQQRLKKHEQHIQEVRKKKEMYVSQTPR